MKYLYFSLTIIQFGYFIAYCFGNYTPERYEIGLGLFALFVFFFTRFVDKIIEETK